MSGGFPSPGPHRKRWLTTPIARPNGLAAHRSLRRKSRRVRARLGVLVFWLGAIAAVLPVGIRAEEDGRYQGPSALAVSADGRTLFVACYDAHQVVWVALPSGNIIRRVDVPGKPTGLVLLPSGRKLYATCAGPKSTVVAFDALSGKQLRTIPAGHTATGPAISPDGARLYVCNRFDGDVSVIDLAAGKQVARVAAGREPVAAAVTPDGRRVVVGNHLPLAPTNRPFSDDVASPVTVIDTQTLQTTTIELRHGAHNVRGVCTLPDDRHALVTHLMANFEMMPFRVDNGWINVNVVSIIDLDEQKVVSTIGLDEYDLAAGNPWSVHVAADGRSVCVTAAGTHELLLIDRSELLGEYAHRTMQPMMAVWPIYLSLGESLWRRVPLPGKGPRAVASAGSKLYVAEYFSDTVAVVDRNDPEGNIDTIRLGPPVKLTPQRRGELLFHDATLCYQHWQSCASCHPDGRTDGLNWDLLNDGAGNPKNTKSMLFSHQTPPAMASGVRPTAEQAVRSGINHILFSDRPDDQASAIDEYLRSLRPVPSPYLVDGRLSPAAQRGRELFFSERIACHRCHPPPLYTDMLLHNVGTANRTERRTRFDTPTLVEVWRTAPYLHDGRYTTIEQLLTEGRHGLKNAGQDLSEQQIEDLVQFVLSL